MAKILTFIGLLMGLWMANAEVNETFSIFEDENTFKINYKGMQAGKLTLKNTIDTANQQFKVSANIKPSLLVRVLGIEKMTALSSGKIIDNDFVMDLNQWRDGDNHPLLTITTYQDKANITTTEKTQTYSVGAFAKEPLTLVTQLGWDLKYNRLPKTVNLILKRGQQTYRVEKKSSFHIRLIQIPNKRRVIDIRYDKNYQLLSLLRTKKGKKDIHVWR